MPADVGEDLARGRVSLVREPDQPMGIRRGPERLLRRRRRSETGHVRLQMPTPVAGALTRPAVVDDHDVPELGTGSVRAAERLAVRNHAAAEPRTEREHHEILDAPSDTCAPLADR